MKRILVISKKKVEDSTLLSSFIDVEIIYLVLKDNNSEIPETKGISGILFWEDLDASEVEKAKDKASVSLPNIYSARFISKSLTPSEIKGVLVYTKLEDAINFLLIKD